MLQTTERHALFIDNESVAPASGESLPVIDPSDGRVFAQIARGSAADVDRAVRAARRAFDGSGTEPAAGPWGRTDAAQRGRILRRWADLVEAECETLARIESRDTGKPLAQARADAQALARYFEFYAGAADKLHGQTIPY
ncbi:MAG: aldehyde dehydrogenase family protein, partial [Burkholderiales bacterium]|nr:aldehyde dehydrogenase family protein [Burkholderiales bacterium]